MGVESSSGHVQSTPRPGSSFRVRTGVCRYRNDVPARKTFSDHICATILIKELHRLANDGSIDPMTWVVMPDHLHWLFALRKGSLGDCMHLLKGRSANAINRAHGRSGPVWQAGYFDHAIRNGESLRRHAQYMIENPIRAGLVAEITAYPYWWCAWDEPFANTSR